MLIAKALLIGLIAFNFSGCAEKQPQAPKVINIPVKCVIPAVPYPEIDNTQYKDNSEIVAKALSNYTKMKEYAEKLLKAQEVCK